MDTTLTSALVSGSLLAAVGIGSAFRRLLPEHHLSADTKDTVKLAMGLVATMTALLLSLLVNSAKGSFDTRRGQVIQVASKVALLDRALSIYGPETAELRREMRVLIEEQMASMWPGESTVPAVKPKSGAGDAFYVAIQNLTPRDDAQRAMKAQAAMLAFDEGQLRSLMLAQSTTSISTPMLSVVVAWLMVIFLGFSLISPPDATATLALIVSAISVAGAIFLILELDRPFGGFIRLSSEPMRNVQDNLGKWGL